MIIKNVTLHSFSLKSTSPSKCRSLMTKTFAEDLGLLTTSRRPGSSPSSAPCPWGSIKDGIKSSSTCQTSLAGPMVATTLKPSESRSMPIAESEEFISQIVSTLNKNSPQSSSCFCPSRNSNDPLLIYKYHIPLYTIISQSFYLRLPFSPLPEVTREISQLLIIHKLLLSTFLHQICIIWRSFCVFCHVFEKYICAAQLIFQGKISINF